MPLLHRFTWGSVIQCLLRQTLIIQVQILVQGLRQALAAEEALTPQQLGDAPVKETLQNCCAYPASVGNRLKMLIYSA